MAVQTYENINRLPPFLEGLQKRLLQTGFGEFVLTKDAVKGLGDGNQRKGIQRAYDMMDNLEARA